MKYILSLLLPICCSCSMSSNNFSKSAHSVSEGKTLTLVSSKADITIFITEYEDSKQTEPVYLAEDEKIRVFGLTVVSKNKGITVKKGKETKRFNSPGCYYINILRSGEWEAGKTLPAFEGILHDKDRGEVRL